MTDYHQEVYDHFEEIEEKKEKMLKNLIKVKLEMICQLMHLYKTSL